ncbi:hypothetical protein ILUMI_26292 [Ignelater luminosus]|uniref:Pacifastin domain-containing protein n=1 Tax=Ignelater luminosus TaxID=2038154 RepID=A0A8K0FXF7_IGNLU|nr:hypothetical protein ILUMI_26292 [Ignelater luminosus]
MTATKHFTTFLVLFILVNSSTVPRTIWRCHHGIIYRENNCRWCFCLLGLITKCMGIICSGEQYYELKQCRIGSTWIDHCNECACIKELGQVCTVKECIKSKHGESDKIYDGFSSTLHRNRPGNKNDFFSNFVSPPPSIQDVEGDSEESMPFSGHDSYDYFNDYNYSNHGNDYYNDFPPHFIPTPPSVEYYDRISSGLSLFSEYPDDDFPVGFIPTPPSLEALNNLHSASNENGVLGSEDTVSQAFIPTPPYITTTDDGSVISRHILSRRPPIIHNPSPPYYIQKQGPSSYVENNNPSQSSNKHRSSTSNRTGFRHKKRHRRRNRY